MFGGLDNINQKGVEVMLRTIQPAFFIRHIFFFFMNGNTERAQCALSQVCIPQEMGKAVKIKKSL